MGEPFARLGLWTKGWIGSISETLENVYKETRKKDHEDSRKTSRTEKRQLIQWQVSLHIRQRRRRTQFGRGRMEDKENSKAQHTEQPSTKPPSVKKYFWPQRMDPREVPTKSTKREDTAPAKIQRGVEVHVPGSVLWN